MVNGDVFIFNFLPHKFARGEGEVRGGLWSRRRESLVPILSLGEVWAVLGSSIV